MVKGALCPNLWRKRSIHTQSRRFNPSAFEVKNGLENGALPFIFAKKTLLNILTLWIFYFNSIKVRLIRQQGGRGRGRSPFQFHKGSINTRGLRELDARRLLFQFHKGSINTHRPGRPRNNDGYFNSIKVRLIRLGAQRLKAIVDNFNSIKVRLIQARELGRWWLL